MSAATPGEVRLPGVHAPARRGGHIHFLTSEMGTRASLFKLPTCDLHSLLHVYCKKINNFERKEGKERVSHWPEAPQERIIFSRGSGLRGGSRWARRQWEEERGLACGRDQARAERSLLLARIRSSVMSVASGPDAGSHARRGADRLSVAPGGGRWRAPPNPLRSQGGALGSSAPPTDLRGPDQPLQGGAPLCSAALPGFREMVSDMTHPGGSSQREADEGA